MQIQPYTYLIKHIPSGKVYYGSRYKNVRLGLRPREDLMVKYFTSCKELQQLIKKEGTSAFIWEVRRTFDSLQKAIIWEQTVLRRCKVLHDPRWFNQNIAGYIVPTAAGLKKISDYHLGKPKSDAHKKNISKALTGKKKSAKHCEALSKAHQNGPRGESHPLHGTHRTLEQNLAHSLKMKGRIAHNKGKAMSQEQKDKLSALRKDRVYTEEQKQKFREAQKKAVEAKLRNKKPYKKKNKLDGRSFRTAEHCQHLSESQKGKVISSETRKKMSESRKGKTMSQESINKMIETRRKNKGLD